MDFVLPAEYAADAVSSARVDEPGLRKIFGSDESERPLGKGSQTDELRLQGRRLIGTQPRVGRGSGPGLIRGLVIHT